MMNKMIVSNLAHRPLRSAISVVAIALEVTLILLIVGFALGMLHDSRSRQAGIGADVIVLPPGSSNIISLSDAAIPVKMADIFSRLPHVAVVSPVILKVSAAGTLQDRKSTRLNSSHTVISYAVFCLKKKKRQNLLITRSTLYNIHG